MSEIKQSITLEEAACAHSEKSTPNHIALNRTAKEIDNISFQAGAEWQKEQDKELITAIHGFIDNAIVDKKIATNQLSYYKDLFRKLIQKHTHE